MQNKRKRDKNPINLVNDKINQFDCTINVCSPNKFCDENSKTCLSCIYGDASKNLCPTEQAYCNINNTCVACLEGDEINDACPHNAPFCAPDDSCKTCIYGSPNRNSCPSSTPHCNRDNNCVECLNSSDCPQGKFCQNNTCQNTPEPLIDHCFERITAFQASATCSYENLNVFNYALLPESASLLYSSSFSSYNNLMKVAWCCNPNSPLHTTESQCVERLGRSSPNNICSNPEMPASFWAYLNSSTSHIYDSDFDNQTNFEKLVWCCKNDGSKITSSEETCVTRIGSAPADDICNANELEGRATRAWAFSNSWTSFIYNFDFDQFPNQQKIVWCCKNPEQ